MGSLDALVSPYGVVSAVHDAGRRYRGQHGLLAMVATAGTTSGGAGRIIGSGRSTESPEQARMIAIAEAAERYAAGDFGSEMRVTATAHELAGEVLDPARYPRCSPAEYARPGCPIVPFDPHARIRWVRGLELTSGRSIWVPAVMACYDLAHCAPAENFTYRISTGYAVHTDPVEAVVGGICEVIERDAIALVWLQRLALAPVGPEVTSPLLDRLVDWNGAHFLRVQLFDATTDLGVPTVYTLQVADFDPRVRTVVGCATGRTLVAAAEKAVAEALTVRGGYHSDDPVPEDYADFVAVNDGARYMAVPERAAAFDFLTGGGPAARGRRRPAGELPEDPDGALAQLVAVFAARDMPAVVVDRTSGDLAEAGLTCVSVVIPDLQPMSLRPLAQFKAHPRLYDAPARMGYPVRAEDELNPWPQPFA